MAENTRLIRPTAVDRALVEAPESLEPEENIETLGEEIEVEVEPNEEGGVEVTFGETEVQVREVEDFYGNLAETLDDDVLNDAGRFVLDAAEDDKNSRKEWEDGYTKGLDLLGLRYENRTEPFDGATGVVHPLLNEAVTQFQAGAYKEMLPATGPVRANIVGIPNEAVEQQAQRVQDYMNYQIMYEMEEYEPEFDQMLYYLGLAGSAFKKIYRDDALQRPVSKFVPAEDVLVPYVSTDLRSAERVTHVIKMSENELRKLQVSGFYRDIEIKGGMDDQTSDIEDKYDELEGVSKTEYENQFTLYECHCYLDLEGYQDTGENGESTGIKLPYIVTVCYDTQDVLSIRRNYRENDPIKEKIQHFVQYKFTPGLGFYGFGLIHLLGNLSRTATANLRQLVDAGTLSNMPAGFKARGLRIADDAEPLKPGEFRDVDVPGGDLRTSLMPLPYKEPSGTLFQLMGFVVGAAEKFIGTTDMLGNKSQEMPVGSVIAILEKGARVVSAVHKRLHSSLKTELRMLGRLFGEDPTPYPYEVGQDQRIKAQDFDERVDILPVSDPNIFSMSQRVVMAQEQLKLAQAAPDLHNLYESYKRMYEALGVKNVDQILNPQRPPTPKDPALENQEASAAARGQMKLQAFPQQDHDAHIAVHQAYMNSKVAQLQPAVLLSLEKHIFEHIGLKAQVIAQSQMQPQDMQNPDMMAGKVAQIQAQVMAEYLQKNPPQQQTDPLVAIKQQEVDIRKQEAQQDAMADQAKLQLDAQKLQQQNAIQRERIDSAEDIAAMKVRLAQERQQNIMKRTGG